MPVNPSGNPHLRPSGVGIRQGRDERPIEKGTRSRRRAGDPPHARGHAPEVGYGVLVCSDGTEAWRELQREDAPRLVVLDWMMPGISGVEICRRLRCPAPSQSAYIILLTAKGLRRDIVTGLQAGADDYVTKPFNVDELRARLGVGDRVVELATDFLVKSNIDSATPERSIRYAVERRRVEAHRESLIRELEEATSRIKTLSGLLPICSACKRIRDDGGYWNELEIYIRDRSDADFSHGICPECVNRLYPGIVERSSR